MTPSEAGARTRKRAYDFFRNEMRAPSDRRRGGCGGRTASAARREMAGWSAICCAIDFSDESRFAMEEAADLARAFEAQLVLVHVHDAPVFGREVDRGRPPLSLGLEAVDLERDICAWRCEAEKRCGSRVRSFVLAGDPAPQLVRFAEDSRADVLVVGKKGRTGLERVELGSVAERLVRGAPCPVLVVREKEPVAYREAPIERPAVERRP